MILVSFIAVKVSGLPIAAHSSVSSAISTDAVAAEVSYSANKFYSLKYSVKS